MSINRTGMLAGRCVLLASTIVLFASPHHAIYGAPRPTVRERIPGLIESFRWEGAIPTSGVEAAEYHAVDEALEKALRDDRIVGCGVALLNRDQIVYCRGFGWAEIDKTNFLPTTATRVGSVSKTVTGVTALRLYEKGILNLDDPVLPLLAKAGIAPFRQGKNEFDPRIRNITVRDLLDQTSGFARGAPYTASPAMARAMGKARLSASDVVAFALGTTRLARDPGVAHEYANINFVIAARVIEAVTKLPYEEAVRLHVLAPMGLTAADAFVSSLQRGPENPARRPNEARYYQWNGNLFPSLFPNDPRKEVSEPYGGFDPKTMDGAGGWAFTINGLARFVSNLLGDRTILGDTAKKALFTPPAYAAKKGNTFPNDQDFYSKGIFVHLWRGLPQIEHDGMLQHAGACYSPLDKNYTAVIISPCNLAKAPWVDIVLRDAVKRGLVQSLAKQTPGNN